MTKKLKIVSVSAELTPFSKTGGLADVASYLPQALSFLGADISVITPLYAQAIDKDANGLELLFENVELRLNSTETVEVSYWRGRLGKSIPVYFVENTKYFSRKKELYGSEHENARFLVFSAAALHLIQLLGEHPDIIHCHDWHTGLIPYYLKNNYPCSEGLGGTKTIYTIHNLGFQMGRDWWGVPEDKRDEGHLRLPHLADGNLENINFARRAILNADAITTVSESYRDEITTKEFGQDLDRLLVNRADRLFGIVNGIDEESWNPANDPGLHPNYDHRSFREHKPENKKFFQKKFGLSVRPGAPVICGTSRMTFQKGFDLILKVLEAVLNLNAQVVLLGACHDKNYLSALKKIARKHPKKFVLMPTHEDLMRYETLAYAASDLFLMPSFYEPCGINQMIAMRYGCVPIVRKVGGLTDTVENCSPRLEKGTGFVFSEFNDLNLFGAIARAMEDYHYEENWNKLVARIMKESHDWDIPALKYLKLFKKVVKW